VPEYSVEIRLASILKCGADIIVMSANPSLLAGSGLSGVIHKAAGPELEAICKGLGPVNPGDCVVTPAYRINAQFIAHTVCPRYLTGSPEEKSLLGSAYRSALDLFEQCGSAKSIAFASMGTGIYRWPLEIAAKIAAHELKKSLFEKTLMCVTDKNSLAVYRKYI
jgi:O-acetyl-ADP-ribose deacetylase (regulator of RNase III)